GPRLLGSWCGRQGTVGVLKNHTTNLHRGDAESAVSDEDMGTNRTITAGWPNPVRLSSICHFSFWLPSPRPLRLRGEPSSGRLDAAGGAGHNRTHLLEEPCACRRGVDC